MYNSEPLSFNTDEVLALIPGMTGSRMNKSQLQLKCPFCGKPKYYIRRDNGLGHCMSTSCPSNAGGSRGFNLWQLYGAVYGLSNSEAIKELKQRLGYNDTRSEAIPQRVVYQAPEPLPIADAGTLNAVYEAFLEELKLADDHRMQLKARGFSDITIDACNFKSFPTREKTDYFALCRRLMSKGLSLKGVPGFFTCKNGSWCFRSVKRGIIMPTKDYTGRIVGLQVRKDDELRIEDEEGGLESKCSWFSSKSSTNGAGAKTFVHFACHWIWDNGLKGYRPYFDPQNSRCILTEGMMKAELIHQFQPNTVVLSVPGVDALYHLEAALKALAEYGATTITLAYDMDYETNPNVQAAMEKTKKIIQNSGLNLWKSPKGTDHARWNVNVEIDGEKVPLLKGMDDYLAYKNLGIIPQIKKVV